MKISFLFLLLQLIELIDILGLLLKLVLCLENFFSNSTSFSSSDELFFSSSFFSIFIFIYKKIINIDKMILSLRINRKIIFIKMDKY